MVLQFIIHQHCQNKVDCIKSYFSTDSEYSNTKNFEPVQPSALSTSSAHNSASIIIGAFVFPEVRSGITESVSYSTLASSSGTLV